MSVHAAPSVTLGWDASAGPNVAGYTLRYGTAIGIHPTTAEVGNALTATATNLTPGTTYFFVVTARNTSGVDSDLSSEVIYLAPGTAPPNQPPTLAAISNLSLSEDSGLQTVSLTGIGSGSASEAQMLTVTASSSNTGLIPNPAVSYVSPNATGSLSFTPVANASGTATLTVTVNDGQAQSNTVTRSFTVTVNPANDVPTLNALVNLTLNTNAGPQTMALAGIGSGAASEAQTLTVTASSSNTGLIPNPAISYVTPATSGSLNFTPVNGAVGSATVTVTVNDGGASNNVVTRSFTVSVNAASTATLFVEAESGTLVTPMVSAANTNASNGRYVYSPTDNQGTVTWAVNIPQAGNYWIWCRTLSITNWKDSFFVAVDGGTEEVYHTAINRWSPNWQWTRINIGMTVDPRIFNLSAGTHSFKFRGREASTLLDALYLSNDPNFVPPATGANQPPALNALANVSLSETLTASDDVAIKMLGATETTGPVVSGLVVESSDARAITLTWQTDEAAICAVEYGPTVSMGNLAVAEATHTKAHLASLRNLQPGSTNYVRIRSTDQAGNVSLTALSTTVTPALNVVAWAAEAGVLTAPMVMVINATALDSRSIGSATSDSGSASYPVQVSVASDYRLWCRVWSPSAGVGSFHVAVDGGAEDIFDAAQVSWRNGWQWVAVNGRNAAAPLTLNPRTFDLATGPHTFVVRAHEAQTLLDELILSNDPDWAPGIQGDPPVLTATAIATDAISLSWTDTAMNETGFQVEWSGDGILFTNLATVPAGTTAYAHTGLTAGSTNYYRMYAFNDADRTDFSSAATASTGQLPGVRLR